METDKEVFFSNDIFTILYATNPTDLFFVKDYIFFLSSLYVIVSFSQSIPQDFIK